MKTNIHTTWEEAVIWLKNQKDQASLIKEAYFDDPLIGAAERFYNGSEWAAVKEYLPNIKHKALDLGAGRGIAAYALSSEGWDTIALEPDHSDVVGAGAIRHLKKETGLPISIIEEYGEQLPFKDDTFLLVYCRQALHHAKNLQKLCKEIGRVLKTGGTLIATREHVISRKEDLPIFLDKHPLHKLYGGEHAYQLSTYLRSIESAGIELIKVLNPLESDINLYPITQKDIKEHIAKRLPFVSPKWIPDVLLKIIGKFDKTPGRLFSFIGQKI